MFALHLDDLAFSYPDEEQPALDGVDLAIEIGSFCALLGPNGAGKTTLVQILCGLLRPSNGRASIEGHSTMSDSCRDLVGYCPQNLALFEPLTAAENLRYFGSFSRIPSPDLERRINQILHQVGLENHHDRRVATFSGGMKRRLNLAVAVLGKPRLLLLDEPTVGIDPQSRNLIFESLEALHEQGTTILYATHYMEEAERMCQQVAIIDHGKVLASGDLADVMATTGSSRVAVTFDDDIEARLITDFEATGVTTRTLEKRSIEIDGNGDRDLLEALMEVCRRHGRSIVSFEVRLPTLEDVFLELTGRQLRD